MDGLCGLAPSGAARARRVGLDYHAVVEGALGYVGVANIVGGEKESHGVAPCGGGRHALSLAAEAETVERGAAGLSIEALRHNDGRGLHGGVGVMYPLDDAREEDVLQAHLLARRIAHLPAVGVCGGRGEAQRDG